MKFLTFVNDGNKFKTLSSFKWQKVYSVCMYECQVLSDEKVYSVCIYLVYISCQISQKR